MPDTPSRKKKAPSAKRNPRKTNASAPPAETKAEAAIDPSPNGTLGDTRPDTSSSKDKDTAHDRNAAAAATPKTRPQDSVAQPLEASRETKPPSRSPGEPPRPTPDAQSPVMPPSKADIDGTSAAAIAATRTRDKQRVAPAAPTKDAAPSLPTQASTTAAKSDDLQPPAVRVETKGVVSEVVKAGPATPPDGPAPPPAAPMPAFQPEPPAPYIPEQAPPPVEPAAPVQPIPAPPPVEPAHPARQALFIVQIAPEMAPVAKVGGLADVVFGLTRELAIRGNHVEIILPKYDSLRYDQIWEMHEVYNDLWVPWYDGAIHCTVYFGMVHERKCYFIEPHSQDNFFNRGNIYGFPDDILRYAFFSRAAMEFLWKSGKHPDVIHCHDWQTALVPVYLYEIYQQLGMTHPRVCLTIHNFKHQGQTGMELLRASGLHHPEHFYDQTRLADNHHPNALNLLKGGIVYANFVTTVSPRYAYETKDQGQGFGLEATLHTHHTTYGGVVNGIDYDVWNPEVDQHIPLRYGVDSVDGKYANKQALRHRLMLADNEKPIVAFIGRLDPQKGLDLVRHAIFHVLERGAQFVLLGSSPEQAINSDFWNLKHMLNDSPDCHLEIGFDEDLAHLIYAGADMILVPSQFEPCGLTQLIALRYGTIPIVREVGGLADTVFDKDYNHRPLHERNGYVFQNYDNPGLESALDRAIACYYNHPADFRELIKNAMRSDYSWRGPGEDYLNIYDLIRNK